eukprot:1377769-Pyramimonas_sp.AAC.1
MSERVAGQDLSGACGRRRQLRMGLRSRRRFGPGWGYGFRLRPEGCCDGQCQSRHAGRPQRSFPIDRALWLRAQSRAERDRGSP